MYAVGSPAWLPVGSETLHDVGRGSLLGHVPPHGGVLAAQHQPKKSNTYQPLIEVRIQRLRCLLRGNKKKTLATLGGWVSKQVSEAKNVAAAERE